VQNLAFLPLEREELPKTKAQAQAQAHAPD
jgi:hypothetical protein